MGVMAGEFKDTSVIIQVESNFFVKLRYCATWQNVFTYTVHLSNSEMIFQRWAFCKFHRTLWEKKLQWLLNSTNARVCVFLGGLNFPQFGYHRGWECRALVWWLVVNWNLLALCANKGTSNPYHLIHTMWVWLALWCNWFVWIYGAKAL